MSDTPPGSRHRAEVPSKDEQRADHDPLEILRNAYLEESSAPTDEPVEDEPMEDEQPAHRDPGPPYEVVRRGWLFTAIAVVAGALAAGYAWWAFDRDEPWHYLGAAVLVVLAVVFVRASRGSRTPLLVADDHGIRLLDREGWSGYLWRELHELEVEPAHGLRHAQIRLVGTDGVEHVVPLGLATSNKVARTERELARRGVAAAY